MKGVQIEAEFAGGASIGPVDVEVPPARATFCDAVVTVSSAVGLGYLAAELHATSARLAAARRHHMARSDLGQHPHTETQKQNTRPPEASALMAHDLAPDAGAGMAGVNARMPPLLVRLERRAKRLRRRLLRLIGGAVDEAAQEDAVVAVEVICACCCYTGNVDAAIPVEMIATCLELCCTCWWRRQLMSARGMGGREGG